MQHIIKQGQTSYRFFRIVDGIELKDLDAVAFCDVKLFVFSEKHMSEINKYCKSTNLNGFYDKSVDPFIKKYFINKICISSIGKGDEIKAEETTMKTINQVINFFRFIICIFAYERIYENRVKVNLLAESYNVSENTFTININDKKITLSLGRGRQSFQKLPINSELLNNLRECYFFDDWSFICSKQNKTELEEAILTAIYWIGEAQNDFTYESAFIKYWIALETLFSISKKEVTESLARGIAILSAFGGYEFIKISDVKKIFKDTEKLYDKRSEIIHRGFYGKVTPLELSEICKYAIWCVLTCFGLRTQGYETLKQIQEETNRLYKLSTRID